MPVRLTSWPPYGVPSTVESSRHIKSIQPYCPMNLRVMKPRTRIHIILLVLKEYHFNLKVAVLYFLHLIVGAISRDCNMWVSFCKIALTSKSVLAIVLHSPGLLYNQLTAPATKCI